MHPDTPFHSWLETGANPADNAPLLDLLSDVDDDEDTAFSLLSDLRQRPQQAGLAAEVMACYLGDERQWLRWAAAAAIGPRGLNARHLEGGLLDTLSAQAPGPSLLTAWSLFAAWGTHEPALTAYATTYLEALLRTGSQGEAIDAARIACLAVHAKGWTPPDAPSTLDAKGLPGALDLRFEDHTLRDLTVFIGQWLGAVTGANTRLTPWIFEGLKLWGVFEREPFMEAMSRCKAEAPALKAGLRQVLALAKENSELMDRPRDLLEAAHRHEGLLRLLMEALAADPDLAKALDPQLFGHELGEALMGEALPFMEGGAPQWLNAHLLGGPPLVSAIAINLVARDPEGATRLAAPLEAAFAQEESGRYTSRFVAEGALLSKLPGRSEAAARRALASEWGDGAARGLLSHALEAKAEGAFERLAQDGGMSLLSLSLSPEGPIAPTQGGFVIAYRRVLTPTPEDRWQTDADEVGVLYLDLKSPTRSRLYPLPVVLPVVRAGGAGAKRGVALAARLNGDLVITLKSPFSGPEGWGTHGRVFALDLKEGTYRLVHCEGDKLHKGAGLDPAKPPIEGDVAPLCFGEPILWEGPGGALRVTADGTPYHLDDWTLAPGVRAALEGARATRRRLGFGGWVGEGPRDAGSMGGGEVALVKGPTRVPLPGAGEFIPRWWPGSGKGNLSLGPGAVSPSMEGACLLISATETDGRRRHGAFLTLDL